MKDAIRRLIKRTPILKEIASLPYWRHVVPSKRPEPFEGSGAYWESRYSGGADSGAGSYGLLARFKADVLNEFVAKHQIDEVIEFGCGDGNQLRLAKYPMYLGFDVSDTAIARCKSLYKSDDRKQFSSMKDYRGETAELALSLDVIYHLVEDDVFDMYMRSLFSASKRFVVIYSSNTEEDAGRLSAHVRHRKFTSWIETNEPEWKLTEHLPNPHPFDGDLENGSLADFFMFEREREIHRQG